MGPSPQAGALPFLLSQGLSGDDDAGDDGGDDGNSDGDDDVN